MVQGGRTWKGGGDGDSCLIGVGPEYFGLLRHRFCHVWVILNNSRGIDRRDSPFRNVQGGSIECRRFFCHVLSGLP